MTAMSLHTPVLNSLLFIRDGFIRDIPEIDGNSAVWSTASCVAVSCLPDCDGKTDITIGNAQEVRIGKMLLFEGRLKTPSHILVVESVLGNRLLEMRVPTEETQIQIWTNGDRDTDRVAIRVV
jgi:hypothetical protein